jgi:hypothetical protein
MSKANNKRDYFAMIPYIAIDMGLSSKSLSLYLHIKRVTGEDSLCWKSQDTLAKTSRMSTKTIIRAKKELEKAGLIEVKLQRIGRYYGHLIKTNDIWEKNNDFYRNNKNGCEVRQTTGSNKDIEIDVKETFHAEETNHTKNTPGNNIPTEFVIKIPGQVIRNSYSNNISELERTPGAVAVKQIDRASPRAETQTLPRLPQTSSIPIDLIKHPCYKEAEGIDRKEAILGISIKKVVEIWFHQGAPIVHLGPGENSGINFPTLDILLADDNIPDRHLIAIKKWLDEVLKKKSKS